MPGRCRLGTERTSGDAPWTHRSLSRWRRRAGAIGELHPRVRAAFDLPAMPGVVMELDVDALLAPWGAAHEMTDISTQPAVYEDLAVIVDEEVDAAQVAALIRQTGGKLLTDVRLFDVYRGGKVPAGKKSLAYALSFQAADRTLTDEETAKLRGKIVSRLERDRRVAKELGVFPPRHRDRQVTAPRTFGNLGVLVVFFDMHHIVTWDAELNQLLAKGLTPLPQIGTHLINHLCADA